MAKRNASGKRLTIGYLAPWVHFSEARAMWAGLHVTACKHDVNLICFPGGQLQSPYQSNVRDIVYELASDQALDGLIMWSSTLAAHITSEEFEAFYQKYRPLPMVSISRKLEGIPSILIDNVSGMRDTVTHLFEAHGFRRVAFVRGPEHHFEATQRYQTFTQVLDEHDIPLNATLIVDGGLGWRAGVEAAQTLLDQRKLEPGKDFQVLVAANDRAALGMLQVLQERGIRVPDDVALVGFDDVEKARSTAIPALTTVRIPYRQIGVQAVENLLAQLKGHDVPERTVVPTKLILGRSCGCPLPVALRPEARPAVSLPVKQATGTIALAAHKEQILSLLAQTMGDAIDPSSELTARLMDAFIGELEGETNAFLVALEDVLQQTASSNMDVFTWQDAVSALRTYVGSCLDGERLMHAYDMLDQARVLVGDIARRLQGQSALSAEIQIQTLNRINAALTVRFDLAELLDRASQEIPRAGIPGCYLSLFAMPEAPTGQARLVMAYDTRQDWVILEPEGRPFPSLKLVPDGLLSLERRYTLVLELLYLQYRQLGFVLFEAEPHQGEACETLQGQLSTALRGVLLLEARQKAEVALGQAYAEVEKQVEERTAELQQEIVERKRVEAERERLLEAFKRRSTHLQTAAEVSRAASSILDPDELIQQAVNLVREQLDLYYTGLFLMDETGEWIVLQAGTGQAGQRMVEQEYMLERDEETAVGWCVINQQARIVPDAGEDSDQFENPLLPETRSEQALPLVSRGKAIGAMTFQSSREDAFSEQDISIFQTLADQLANAITTARLYDQAQRELNERKQMEQALKHRLEQLAALSQASQAVTASLEPSQVLAEIVSLANGVVGSNFTSVILVDEAGNIHQTAENMPGVQALRYRPRPEGFTRWIVRLRRTVIIDQIEDDGTVYPDVGEGAPAVANPRLVETGIKSLAGLPLMVKDRLLGVLYLHSLRPNSFGGQLFLLSAFANQVAIAIENARLFQTEQQQTKRLALLGDIARIAATTFDADALLQGVADSISRHFEYPRVGLFTLDEDGQTLLLRGRSGISEEMAALGIYQLPVDQGISGHVARTGQSYLSGDVNDDDYFVNPANVPIRSALCVPVLDAGRVTGTLIVESEQVAAFDEGDLSLLESVADTVTIGLRNARLYRETQRRVQELTLLNRISVGPGMAQDIDTMIGDTVMGLHELVAAEHISFVHADLDLNTWQVTHTWTAPGLKPHTGLCGHFDGPCAELKALSDGQPFAVSDAATDSRIIDSHGMYRGLEAKSALMTPIHVGGRFYGVLSFSNGHEKHVWHPDEVRLSEAVAHQLALVLENAHLFEETQLRAEELAAALTQLEEMDRLKDEFIQNVSHELRSPLALIRGYAEMLDSGELGEIPPAQKMPVAVISRRARMLSSLVKDITLILEAEISPPDPEPIQLDELAQNAVEDFQVAVKQAELVLEAESASDLPPVSGSPTYLRRVLDNLLGNAVKFTPPGGTITVRLHQEGAYVALEVCDTGVGIPPDKLPRVFERFYQVDGSTSRRYGGMGLGLALVKEIVEAYGGRVTVESQVNEGSTFIAFLPLAVDTQETTPEEEEEEEEEET